jgi:PAS domain S-box-containing protein
MAEKPTYEELEQRIQELEQVEFNRKRAEKAWQESERNYKNIFDNVQVGLFRSRLSDGKMVMANKRMAALLSYPNAEECLEKYVAIEHYEYPELRDKLVETIHEHGKVTNFEAPIKKDDGSVMWLQFSGSLSSEEGYFEGVATDMTASKLAEEQLRYSNTIKAAIAKASSLFVSSGEVDYDMILQIIGESGYFNRAYIFQIHGNGCQMSNTFEWCAHGTDPKMDMLQDLDTRIFPWWMEQLRNGKNIVIRNVAELPPEAAAEKEILQAQQIRSLIVLPIWSKGKSLWGFMGFDDTERTGEWREPEIEALQILGEMISGDLERRASEDKLTFERQQLLSIFDSIDEDIYVADPNTYEILYVNQSMQDAFQKKLIGGICYREFQGLESPCAFCTNEILLKQKPAPYRWEYHNPILNRDVVIIDRLIQWPDGRDVRFELAIDITERKQAEMALRESETKYRNLVENAPLGVLSIDRRGRIVEANSWLVQMLGSPSAEATKRINLFTFQPLVDAGVANHFRQCLENGKIGVFETPYTSKWGQEVYLRYHIRPIEDDSHGIVGVQGIVEDISDAKLAETQLRQAQKIEAIGTLAGGIAHDFNNILFPIVGMSEMLMERFLSDNREYEDVREIYRAGLRARDLVNQILAFSRQSERKRMPTRIQQVLKEVLKLGRSTIPANIEITQDIQSDCGLVMSDPSQFHQIVMNLVTNAYHAVEKTGGRISVQLKETELGSKELAGSSLEPGRYAMLSIFDTGCGIDPAVMDKIFEPYFTTKEQGKGTGLGLAVVFGIVKKHQGDIKVYSEAGMGTTFKVYFPLMEKSSEEVSVREVESYETGTEKILLVDDEESVVKIEKLMLERLGYHVTARLSSVDALEAFKNNLNKFDLVVTDMAMPNMTGDQLAKELISIKPDIPVIICTGFSENISQEKAAAMGIKGFLMKPIVTSEMAQVVRKVLDR